MAKKNKNSDVEPELIDEKELDDSTFVDDKTSDDDDSTFTDDKTFDDDDSTFTDDKTSENDSTFADDKTFDDDEEEEPVTMTGTVTTRLNIRENDTGSPDTTIVSIVEGGEEITVYPEEGNATFFKVKTKNGVEGYAMRRYIILDVE